MSNFCHLGHHFLVVDNNIRDIGHLASTSRVQGTWGRVPAAMQMVPKCNRGVVPTTGLIMLYLMHMRRFLLYFGISIMWARPTAW